MDRSQRKERVVFNGRGLTAAELVAWLVKFPPETQVMIHSNTKEHRYWLEVH